MAVTFSENTTLTLPEPTYANRIFLVDADGDGDLDVLYQTGSNGSSFR